MAQQKMELRKVRDFGENISDTFQFIKQELKPLLITFFSIVGIFILLSGIVSALYERESGGIKNIINIFKHIDYQQQQPYKDVFTPMYFLSIFLSVFNWIVMRVTLAAYVKIYDLKGGASPTIEEVVKEVLRYFVPVFFYSILVGIIIVFGTVLCLVPGIYLAVVFMPINFIFLIEDRSVGDAINRCFVLIKENFWQSLGLYIVVSMIYYICSLVVGLTISLIAGAAAYLTTKDIGNTIGIVTAVLSIFEHVFYIIFSISVALNYFNLVELKDGEGLLRKVQNLGTETQHSTIEEQY